MCEQIDHTYACGHTNFFKYTFCASFPRPCLGNNGTHKIQKQSGKCSGCREREKNAKMTQNPDPFPSAEKKARGEEKARNAKK